jgi:hypothetical protein
MLKECRLTTIDNPFDPFEQFTSWYLFDMEKGYDCCGRIDRLINVSDDMTEFEVEKEKERAIDRLIEIDPLDIYKKVVREKKEEA